MFPVYLITCTHSSYGSHIMPYVGCVLMEGRTIQQRFERHCKEDGCPYLHRAINKYGREHFIVEQIDAGNTVKQAKELERWWIKRLNTKHPHGYNLTDGGDGTLGMKKPHLSRLNSDSEHQTKAGLVGGLTAVKSGQLASIRVIGGQAASRKNNHTRWHVSRGIKKEGCELCL